MSPEDALRASRGPVVAFRTRARPESCVRRAGEAATWSLRQANPCHTAADGDIWTNLGHSRRHGAGAGPNDLLGRSKRPNPTAAVGDQACALPNRSPAAIICPESRESTPLEEVVEADLISWGDHALEIVPNRFKGRAPERRQARPAMGNRTAVLFVHEVVS